jgi:hypothetical protein
MMGPSSWLHQAALKWPQKEAIFNGANLEAVIRGIQKALSIYSENRIFTALSFSHTYGLSQFWLMAKTGATLAVVPDITEMATIKKILYDVLKKRILMQTQ